MPFWWKRRRRPWFGRWRQRRYRFRQTRKRRRRYPRRYKRRRTTRRRRRRRGKVRRKKPFIPLRQWQPDSINKCKIKGFGELVLGAEGTQFLCYTNQKYDWAAPLTPGGGGFGVERFTLQYLYDQHIFRNNIWTKTNQYKDLCRYLFVKFTFYAHPKIDFIINYNRQPPFNIDKTTYPSFHPLLMLLGPHKRILPSKQSRPNGKHKLTLTIKPPKQMISKWFFMKQFADYDLCQIAATACTLSYPRLGCCNENRIITIQYLNPEFFQDSTWAQMPTSGPYVPYTNISRIIKYYSPTVPNGYTPNFWNTPETEHQNYYDSISNDKGWFSKKILGATKVEPNTHHLPLAYARYNPAEDNGKGNQIWLTSVVTGQYKRPTEDILLFDNTPIWLAFFGWWNYVQKLKDKSFMSLHMFVIKSPFIKPPVLTATRNYFPFVDANFVQGNNPNKSPLTYNDKKLWYPTCWHQVETINSFVECGPYIPKLNQDRESTWELPYKYSFHFKWGGPQMFDQEVNNPKDKNTYPVPDTLQEGLQISNPSKQKTESILHEWDFRRGFVTNAALERMQKNILTDSDVQTDSEGESKKRKRVTAELHNPEEKTKKIKTCLLSLCESSTSQEEAQTSEDLLKLINKQREQQHLLKQNLITLLTDLKYKQKLLQLQTGVLE
nr:MAG: ORF1 [Torque teno midi virus]